MGYKYGIPKDQRDHYGTIHLRSIDLIEHADNKGTLKVTQNWINSEGRIVLEEQVEFNFYASEDKRIIDRTTTFTAAIPEVVFEDNKEGAIAVQVARFLELPSDEPLKNIDANGNPSETPLLDNTLSQGNYLSSEGLEGNNVWGTRAKWKKLYGHSEGEFISIVLMDHPGNPGYPTYWDARGYGLFSANPFGQKVFSNGKEKLNFKLMEGESATFRHRMLITSGMMDISNEEIDRDYKQFTN